MRKPRIGEVWEQHSGKFVGRRGKVADLLLEGDYGIGNSYVVLNPYPGFCPCPLKQRRTRMKMETFLKQFHHVRWPKGHPHDA